MWLLLLLLCFFLLSFFGLFCLLYFAYVFFQEFRHWYAAISPTTTATATTLLLHFSQRHFLENKCSQCSGRRRGTGVVRQGKKNYCLLYNNLCKYCRRAKKQQGLSNLGTHTEPNTQSHTHTHTQSHTLIHSHTQWQTHTHPLRSPAGATVRQCTSLSVSGVTGVWERVRKRERDSE